MSFYHLSEGYFLENIVYKPAQLNNLIFMEYKSSHLDGRSLVAKRIFDLVGATLGLILLSPLLLLNLPVQRLYLRFSDNPLHSA